MNGYKTDVEAHICANCKKHLPIVMTKGAVKRGHIVQVQCPECQYYTTYSGNTRSCSITSARGIISVTRS